MRRQVCFYFGLCAVLALASNSAMGALSQYWTFDSDASNSVVGGVDGTFVGAATIGTSVGEYSIGAGALKLSHDTSTGDFVDIAGQVIPVDHPTAFTISSWFKHDPLMGSQSEDSRQFIWETSPASIYPSGAGIHASTDKVCWYMQAQSAGTIAETGRGASVDDGQWHHIAIVYDYLGGNTDLYLDGALDQHMPAAALTSPTDGLHIGNHRYGDGGRNWRGYIDDFAIYEGTLDAAGVAGLYDKTLTPLTVPVTPIPDLAVIPDTPLQAYWTFDSDYSSTVNNYYYEGEAKGGAKTSISGENTIRGSGALKISNASGGTSAYVDITREVADPDRDKQITISAWYNLTDIDDDGMDSRRFVWESSPTYSLSYSVGSADDGEWWFRYDEGSNSDTTGPIVTEGEWNHVVMVLDMEGDTIQYYHNGVLIDDVEIDPDAQIRAMDGFHIGSFRDAATDHTRDFDGYIDDVAVFHGLLDADGVAALYSGTATPLTVNVIVPEPSSLAILLSAAFASMFMLRRRQ